MNRIISAWNELGVSTKQNNTKFHRENHFTEKSKQQSCHHFEAKIAAGLATIAQKFVKPLLLCFGRKTKRHTPKL